MSYTSTPFHALSPHDLHVPPKAALRCAYVVDPTGGQRVPSPRQHTTSSATRARPRRGIPAYPRVFHSHPVQKLGTGDQDAYLREKYPRTCGGNTRVPRGEVPAYLREKSRVPTGEIT